MPARHLVIIRLSHKRFSAQNHGMHANNPWQAVSGSALMATVRWQRELTRLRPGFHIHKGCWMGTRRWISNTCLILHTIVPLDPFLRTDWVGSFPSAHWNVFQCHKHGTTWTKHSSGCALTTNNWLIASSTLKQSFQSIASPIIDILYTIILKKGDKSTSIRS